MDTEESEVIFVVTVDVVLEKSLLVFFQDICDILIVVLYGVDCLVYGYIVLALELFVLSRFECLAGLPKSLLILAVAYVSFYFRYVHCMCSTSLVVVPYDVNYSL